MKNVEPCQDKVLLSVCKMDWCDIGVEFAKTVFSNLEVFKWDDHDTSENDDPARLRDWEGDWIISYRGDYIFPKEIYSRARKGAINFHPAPPKYRGLGSQFYAIYYGDETYGSTCHHLAPSVDSGQIINVARFNVAPAETASSLRLHVGAYCLQQYIELVTDYIVRGRPLPQSTEHWGERLYKQAELKPWMEKVRREEPDHRCFK
ncbi:methionyl-tRNA formyltransferase [Burkholderia sp. WAC0059]|uniref:formyltransferase family protein n=1 Tax=Burkholderia sp. WAC0059 TaxID=2066022 RepID=UPI000C7EB22B|nr:formyltransferase family protein [Burkholderia sp. WAC0059]PLZ01787.1 methionyl-tRNA formyltransferase [Burkholderia sp. WAC0059]